jgi:hypothetical protein
MSAVDSQGGYCIKWIWYGVSDPGTCSTYELKEYKQWDINPLFENIIISISFLERYLILERILKLLMILEITLSL